jgi:hypothetical protein
MRNFQALKIQKSTTSTNGINNVAIGTFAGLNQSNGSHCTFNDMIIDDSESKILNI